MTKKLWRSPKEPEKSSSLIITDYDWSMMKVFCDCRRKFYCSHILGIHPKPSIRGLPGAMEFGWCIDQALDNGYQLWALSPNERSKLFEDCFSNAPYEPTKFNFMPFVTVRKSFKELWGNTKNKGYHVDRGLAILDEYMATYWPEQFDIVDSDVKGIIPLFDMQGQEINLRFKIDLLYHLNKNYYVMETKTTSQLTDVWWFGKQREYQTDGYHMGAELYFNQKIRAVTINAIATKAAVTAAKQDKLRRRDLLKPSARRKRYLRWLHNTIEDCIDLQERMLGPYNGTDFESIHEAAYHMWRAGDAPHELWTETPTYCTAFFKQCEYGNLCENDFHTAEMQNYVRSEWQPYMGHETFKGEAVA